jgi:enterochelin esterase-like enzyme
MGPDSLGAQLVSLAVAVLAAVATAVLWDRVRGRAAWLFRPVALAVCLLGAATAVLVGVDRWLELYPTWNELLGQAPVGAANAPRDIRSVAGGGRVVEFTVTGAASHLKLTAYAYLPPGYDTTLKDRRLPVVEALDGFPGSPQSWLKGLSAPAQLDQEIASGRMAPTVVVFPYQTVTARQDTECVNAVGGVAMDTFLSTDVPAAVESLFRVRTDAAAWGLIGYSTGGFCAVNLALRHPDRYSAAASLSGYFHAYTDSRTGDLYRGNQTERDLNSPLWRLRNLPVPPLSLFLATATDDKFEYTDLQRLVALRRPPLRVTTVLLAHGGHSTRVWKALEPAAFDWLSSWLAGPQLSLGGR